MNIKKLFNKNVEFNEEKILEDKENVFLLRELYSCAVRGDGIGFNRIIQQPIDVLSPFAFEMQISAGIDGKDVAVDQSYDDHYSFLSFCLEKKIDEGFIKSLIEKITPKQAIDYFKYAAKDKSINFISQCVQTGKLDTLDLMLNKGLVSESGIYQTILFYSREFLEKFIDKDILNDAALFHQTFKELKPEVYYSVLGLEDGLEPQNKNVGIFTKIYNRTMIDVITKSLSKMDFRNYSHKDVLVDDLVSFCVKGMCTMSNEMKRTYQNLNSFSDINTNLYSQNYTSYDKEVVSLVLEMCRNGLLDIDSTLNIKLESGEIGQRNISDWLNIHSSLHTKVVEVKTEILERKLNLQVPSKEDNKRAKI